MTTATYKERLDRLTQINATHLRNSYMRNEGMLAEIVSHIVRYVSEDDVKALIQSDADGTKAVVSGLIENAISHIAEEKAEAQAEKYGGTAEAVMELIEQESMCLQDISDRLFISLDKVRQIIADSPACVVGWGSKNGRLVRLYGLPAEKVAA